MKKITEPYQFSDWQKNPQTITSKTVQFWRNGIMLTAQITQSDARQMVVDGSAFAITSQAIGAIKDNQPYA